MNKIITDEQMRRIYDMLDFDVFENITWEESYIDSSFYGEIPCLNVRRDEMNKIIEMGLDTLKSKIWEDYNLEYGKVVDNNKIIKLVKKFKEDIVSMGDGVKYKPAVEIGTYDYFTEQELSKVETLRSVRDSKFKELIAKSKVDNELLTLCDTYEEKKEILDKWIV